jgi:hypothetical protein
MPPIPAGFKLSPAQQLQRQAVVTGKPHLDQATNTVFPNRLKYPLYYLDIKRDAFNAVQYGKR